jgi:hypothetical protein
MFTFPYGYLKRDKGDDLFYSVSVKWTKRPSKMDGEGDSGRISSNKKDLPGCRQLIKKEKMKDET